MSRFVLYTDIDGKIKVKISEKVLKEEAERKRKDEEEKKRLEKKTKNEHYLNKWIEKRKRIKQDRFIEYLKGKISDENWKKWERLIRRLISKIDIRENDKCWTWLGSVSSNDYGTITINNESKLVHRVLYKLCIGSLSHEILVRHKCNNKLCVNPEHLELGTHQDNSRDMINAGLSYKCAHKRDNNPMAILKNDEPGKIRKEYHSGGITQHQLAVKYGITDAEISNIINNKNWKGSICDNENIRKIKIENTHGAKLNWKIVKEIRKKHENGEKVIRLSKHYGVSNETMRLVINNEIWKENI
ncbi:MAG: HNH endonuclease signature motif containing protein [Candidatus Dojkabacteria bacterium]|nr:HNH endonuclease signature motif containing protein [Candidatus Dojkabacteria bacterium]